jgi:hypothetical protein
VCRVLVLSVVALTVSACFSTWFHRGGDRAELQVEIEFVDPNGKAAAAQPAYVVERFGTSRIVTEVLNTEDRGGVRLAGQYCLPMQVVMVGGAATIRQGDVSPTVRVTLDRDRYFASLEATYGLPQPKHNKQGRRHLRPDCG